MARTTEQVVEAACTTKRAHEGPTSAARAARRARRRGEQVTQYRCPFCSRWHVGHVPSMESVADIARAIRDLHGNAPGPVGRMAVPA